MANQKDLDKVYMDMANSMSTLSHGQRARVQNPLTGKRVSKQLSLNTYSEEYALKVLHVWVKEMHILFEYGDNHGS